jgi:uncharacterized membrane protein
MSTNPNQNQQPDPSKPQGGYGGYSGYNPSNPNDPYNANQQQQQSGAGSQRSDPNYVYGQGGQQYAGGSQQQQQQQYAPGQQQSNTYVPPSSVRGSAGSSSTTSTSRRTALISYLGLCFTGIVIFIFGRKNRFIQFHAAQSIIVFTPLVIAYAILQFIGGILGHILIIGWILSPIVGCLIGLIVFVGVVLWLLLMLQAYRGVMFKLPIIGNYADALVDRFSGKSNKNA